MKIGCVVPSEPSVSDYPVKGFEFLKARVSREPGHRLRLAVRTFACKSCPPVALWRASLVLLFLGCLSIQGIRAQDDKAKADEQKIKKAFYTSKDRLAAMHSAALFVPKAVAETDIMEGPEQNKHQFQLHYNDKVICDFTTPGSKMGGKTPKFECKITSVVSTDGKVQTLTPDMDEEPVKVKFGGEDNEVFAEVVATRLMWALGYYADSWFPVQVECHNCP